MEAPLGTFENPRPYDILCGRNRNSFNNIGNRRFRITINMNVEKYNSLQSRHARSKFIASLAHTMRYEIGFRFLKKKSGKGSETVDLTDDEVRAKIGHALRDLSTVLRENGGDEGTADAKVPRPGPYKKQDKQLKSAASSSSLETIPSGNITSAVVEDKKPAPEPVSSSSTTTTTTTQDKKTAQIPTIQEEKPGTFAAPDQVRSSTPPLVGSCTAEEMTPLKSNQIKSVSKMFSHQDHDDLKLFPLEVGEVCQSLLTPPPESMLPSLDDDDDLEDEYWTHSELQNERSAHSGRSQRTSMSIGTFDLNTTEGTGRSQRTSMSVGTFDLNTAEGTGRSQRTALSVGTFDMSLNSSCCLSDAIETLSLVST